MPESTFIFDDKEVQKKLKLMKSRLGSLQPANEIIGEIVHSSILRNFEEGGRPEGWPDLADSTKKQREKEGSWPGQILVRNGARNGLMGAVSYDALPDAVVFIGNKEYSAIQHFGGKAGRGRKTTIPARKYMMVQDEDWDEIMDALNHYIFEV